MLRDSVSAMEFSQPRVYHNCSNVRTLFGGRPRISYDLSLATLSHELGVSFSRLRHDPPGSYLDQLRDALVCSYYVRCVSTPRDFWRTFSVNHSRTGAGVELRYDNTQGRASRLSVPQGYRSPDYSLSPGRHATGLAIQAPRSKRMTRPCASRTLLSSCLRGLMPAHAVGNPGAPGPSRRGPAQGLFVDRSYVPVLASATAPRN